MQVKLLLESGASAVEPGAEGKTPSALAMLHDNDEALSVLQVRRRPREAGRLRRAHCHALQAVSMRRQSSVET